jgi:fructose-1-phosphate kinase PfkB-like protein
MLQPKKSLQRWSRNCGCFSWVAGAVLVTKDSYDYVPVQMLLKKSTVGAGDSMVVEFGPAQNKPLKEVIVGVACGSAATMNEGTQLNLKMLKVVRMVEG